jgi:hypothetical protein
MPDHASMFDVALNRRGRIWAWRVCTAGGNVIMQGSESTRSAARYKANHALFLLLLAAPYRSGLPAAVVPPAPRRHW